MSSLRLGTAVVAYSRDAPKTARLARCRFSARGGSFGLSGDSTRCATIRPVLRSNLRRYRGVLAKERSPELTRPAASGGFAAYGTDLVNRETPIRRTCLSGASLYSSKESIHGYTRVYVCEWRDTRLDH